MIAPVISCMQWKAASRGESPSRSIRVWQFSVTTMASSHKEPITRTSPSIVRRFIEYPSASIIGSVARSDIGMATQGTSVAR